MSNMDYFEGIKNEEFVDFFLQDLNCRKELTQYIYPHEQFEPEDALDDHIERCQNILKEYMREIVVENAFDIGETLQYEEYNDMIIKRFQEVLPLLEPHILKYSQNVKIETINFSENNKED